MGALPRAGAGWCGHATTAAPGPSPMPSHACWRYAQFPIRRRGWGGVWAPRVCLQAVMSRGCCMSPQLSDMSGHGSLLWVHVLSLATCGVGPKGRQFSLGTIPALCHAAASHPPHQAVPGCQPHRGLWWSGSRACPTHLM